MSLSLKWRLEEASQHLSVPLPSTFVSEGAWRLGPWEVERLRGVAAASPNCETYNFLIDQTLGPTEHGGEPNTIIVDAGT